MNVFLPLFTVAAAFGCASTDSAFRNTTSGEARIEIERGSTTVVRALFDGASSEALTYRLEVVREGTAGRSQSAQGGEFESAADRTDTLSTVRVSAVTGDRFKARLVVRRGDDAISETRLDETVQ